jgi:hypothetical protein
VPSLLIPNFFAGLLFLVGWCLVLLPACHRLRGGVWVLMLWIGLLAGLMFSRWVGWCLYFFAESLILAQDERWRRA